MYIAHWKDRLAIQQRQNQALTAQARQKLPQLLQHLVKHYQATHIILFGSLAKGTFHEGSDIDIAVAGISSADYFTALAAVQRLSDPFQIDLKPIEDLDPHFYQRVMQTGECLYGADICRSGSGNCS